MRWPAPTVLEAVLPHVPPELVGAAQLESCQRIAEGLRFEVDAYYLECRLEASPQVDFLLLTRSRQQAAARLRESFAAAPLPAALRPTLALLDGWSGGDAILREAELVWLEYDGDDRLDLSLPVPSPSLCLERDYLARSVVAPTIDRPEALRRAHAAAHYLVDDARRELVRAHLERCDRALPAGASLIYFSEMLTRTPRATKLYISLPKSSVLQFLDSFGWPGNLADISDILGAYASDVATAFLDLSITDRVTGRLGVAFSQFQAQEIADFDPAWQGLPMRGIVDQKRAALRGWPGQSEAEVAGSRYRVERWLDIKVVLDETRRLSHKAYLGFKPGFRRLLT